MVLANEGQKALQGPLTPILKPQTLKALQKSSGTTTPGTNRPGDGY